MKLLRPILNYTQFLKQQKMYDLCCLLVLCILASWSLLRVSYQSLQGHLPSHTTQIERFCCTPSPIVFSSQMYIDQRFFNFFFEDGTSQILTKGQLVDRISHFYFKIFFRHYFQIPFSSNRTKATTGMKFFFCDFEMIQRFGFKQKILKVQQTTVFKNSSGAVIKNEEVVEALCY